MFQAAGPNYRLYSIETDGLTGTHLQVWCKGRSYRQAMKRAPHFLERAD